MVSNSSVNIQDVCSLWSDLPDLHESSTVGTVGRRRGGKSFNMWKHWCRIMQPCYDHSNTFESWELIHNDKINHFTAGLMPFLPCRLVHFQKDKRNTRLWVDEALLKTRLRGSDRPAFCIWRDRGEPQLCVWCHSSEFHQSRTGPNTSESRTHNCLPPLKKHRWDFRNRASLGSERRKLFWDV